MIIKLYLSLPVVKNLSNLPMDGSQRLPTWKGGCQTLGNFANIFYGWSHARLVGYSSVPNRRACMLIDFGEKIPSAVPYFGLHLY